MNFTKLALIATLSLSSAAIYAQAPATTSKPTINQRKENQQDRIAQGVKNGTLSPSEAARLEHQEAGINKEERGMRAQNNGHLTAQDRKTLRQQQNVESKRIYNKKHDLHGNK
ncbi:hypothetical protein [Edaphobacter bradus]|uniref:hypothetical protein n=1 Tax=Edaphobacter bradus TaxID=2259016 RepID=UPI0021DF7E8F|nr:hypothetical protein [Edaphobacter bradus]